MKGKLNISIKVENIISDNYSTNNYLTITGYTNYGIMKEDLIDWVDDVSGEVINRSPLVLVIYSDKGSRDDVAVDQFISWIEDEAGKSNVHTRTTKEDKETE